VGNELIDFPAIANRFVGGDVAAALGSAAALVNAIVAVGLILLILIWLDRNRISIRV
jgi:hypothetical protein